MILFFHCNNLWHELLWLSDSFLGAVHKMKYGWDIAEDFPVMFSWLYSRLSLSPVRPMFFILPFINQNWLIFVFSCQSEISLVQCIFQSFVSWPSRSCVHFNCIHMSCFMWKCNLHPQFLFMLECCQEVRSENELLLSVEPKALQLLKSWNWKQFTQQNYNPDTVFFFFFFID